MFSAEASLLAMTRLTWSPDLCAVSWESKGDPDRSPETGCRAKTARAACVPPHVICVPHDSGTDGKEMGRNYILERAVEST